MASDPVERVNRTMALESLLKRFGRELDGLRADSEAVSAGVAYQIKFYEDERDAAQKVRAEANKAIECAARTMALAAEMLAATRSGDEKTQERVAESMAKSLASGSQQWIMDAKMASAAAGYLRELARDGNWRHVEFVENGKMQTLVLWDGPIGADGRHPAWLASRCLKWLLGEEVSATQHGRGIGYGLRGDIIQELSEASKYDYDEDTEV